jgi:hypothetical protein
MKHYKTINNYFQVDQTTSKSPSTVYSKGHLR